VNRYTGTASQLLSDLEEFVALGLAMPMLLISTTKKALRTMLEMTPERHRYLRLVAVVSAAIVGSGAVC